jgi:hypothetical protein
MTRPIGRVRPLIAMGAMTPTSSRPRRSASSRATWLTSPRVAASPRVRTRCRVPQAPRSPNRGTGPGRRRRTSRRRAPAKPTRRRRWQNLTKSRAASLASAIFRAPARIHSMHSLLYPLRPKARTSRRTQTNGQGLGSVPPRFSPPRQARTHARRPRERQERGFSTKSSTKLSTERPFADRMFEPAQTKPPRSSFGQNRRRRGPASEAVRPESARALAVPTCRTRRPVP